MFICFLLGAAGGREPEGQGVALVLLAHAQSPDCETVLNPCYP